MDHNKLTQDGFGCIVWLIILLLVGLFLLVVITLMTLSNEPNIETIGSLPGLLDFAICINRPGSQISPDQLGLFSDPSIFLVAAGTVNVPAINTQIPRPYPTYPGGKDAPGVAQEIINHIAAHSTYIEPCLGNGSIFRKKRLADYSIIADAEKAVIDAWEDVLPDAAGAIRFIGDCTISLEWAFYSALIEKHIRMTSGQLQRTFIYWDPPYPGFVRSSKNRMYKKEMMKIEEHEALLTTLNQLDQLRNRPMQMISSYDNELYNDHLQGWHKHTFAGRSRQGVTEETIWMNYDISKLPLHDYRYIGSDKRKREDNRAKVKRWLASLDRMEPRQREAILQGIQDKFL